MLMSAGLRPKPKRLRVGFAFTSWKSCRAVLSESSMLARPMNEVVIHPHARDVVASAREPHAVMIAVGAVESAQKLHWPLRLVVDQARHGEQRCTELDLERRRARRVRELRADRLLGAGNLDPGLFEQLQHRLRGELAAPEPGDGGRHV